MTTIEYRSHVVMLLQAAKTLLCAGDYRGIAKLVSGGYLTDLWAAAMTAHFGPCGAHPSRLDANGQPSAETLAEFPRLGERMAEARYWRAEWDKCRKRNADLALAKAVL